MPKREFQATRNGLTVNVPSVALKIRAHFDEMVVETYDDLARELDAHPLDTNLVYYGDLRVSVREWETQDHKKAYSNSVTLTRINAV